MSPQVRVAILDDHQSIIDGYTYRLSVVPEIQIVAMAVYGEDLETMLASHKVDVLLLDVSVFPALQRTIIHFRSYKLFPVCCNATQA
jgi:DNA-binding NarL/FixJ family response regulator